MKKNIIDAACYLVDTCTSNEELEFLCHKIFDVECKAPSNYFNYNAEILGHIFEYVAQPDDNGSSDWVNMDYLTYLCPLFNTTNGGNWYRDNQTYLGKKYIILAYKEEFDEQGNNFKNRRRKRLVRYKTPEEIAYMPNHQIPQHIMDHFSMLKKNGAGSVFSGDTNNLEVDHKNGRYTNTIDPMQLTIDDFQLVTKSENDRKREICKKCRASNIRYDATRLGYPVSCSEGSIEFDSESENGCEGCYMFDPIAFRQTLYNLMKRQEE